MSTHWSKGDLTQYNYAKSPYFYVQANGKVDISPDLGDQGTKYRVSLHPWGMYKMVEEWLQSGHQLKDEQKKRLVELLGGKFEQRSL